jgi:glycosyltransferase involved in cell wall biosynthesis
MKPDITVVLTSFNRGEKLRRAVDSVRRQSLKHWELIIVDDGSEQETVQIVQAYAAADERIRAIYRAENFGQHTRPKNEGTLAAATDYIAYLDDDNAYRPEHLEMLWEEMCQAPVDVVYGDRMVVSDSCHFSAYPGVRSDFSLDVLHDHNFIDTSDVLCRKTAILEVGGWDEKLPFLADWNLWIRMARNGASFRRLNVFLTDYYVHDRNNLRRAAGLSDEERARWIVENIRSCPLWPESTVVRPHQVQESR